MLYDLTDTYTSRNLQSSPIIRDLGYADYYSTWIAMKDFVANAAKIPSATTEEIWFVEHPPVFTLGQSGKIEHVLAPGDIPLLQVDRGGQVTYHGPGQLVIYFLLNLRARKMGIRDLVHTLEHMMIELLAEWGILAQRREKAPGVYVEHAKIASLGLRVRQGWTYHGLSLNVKMDLEPFQRINPCGMAGLAMTQIADFYPPCSMKDVQSQVTQLIYQYIPMQENGIV